MNMKKVASAAAVAVAVSASAVMVAAPASAADQKVFSSSGKSYGWYDDGNDQFVTCDLASNDGDGTWGQVVVELGGWIPQRTVFNGCETISGIPDGHQIEITVCDWVWRAATQQRGTANCTVRWVAS
ncbi:hypothetical protein [Phycicoccus jejuensis]|uniref:hypothetical protein n=1 Tax=Phycicoccus jejuensis TaxID=367299 RepID=UPI0004C3B9A1|nr:hypothetical protein [Phycicoccus jejuensis]